MIKSEFLLLQQKIIISVVYLETYLHVGNKIIKHKVIFNSNKIETSLLNLQML